MEQQGVGNDDVLDAMGKRLSVIIDCSAAIAKVMMLLFIKMLLLPLLLGVWIDIATLSLFEKTLNDRIAYAGSDLFGSIFLHWVTGITFMLIVTVSVLQLREVAHPDLLARVIRPQEPQPDLLGNLLQENGAAHTKRILLSLSIYAALLMIHIWLPSHFLFTFNMGRYLPFFRPKFWHIFMPQVQVPAELFVFHLSMLAFLEKYKNNIGEMQHHWLVLMGNLLGLTDRILPQEVEQFVLIGTLPVFAKDLQPDKTNNASFQNGCDETFMDHKQPRRINDTQGLLSIWNELLSTADPDKRESIIHSSIDKMEKPSYPCYVQGLTRRDGKKSLSLHTFLRFPSGLSNEKLTSKRSDNASSNLLPTSIGPYRLKQRVLRKSTFVDSLLDSKPMPRVRNPLIVFCDESIIL